MECPECRVVRRGVLGQVVHLRTRAWRRVARLSCCRHNALRCEALTPMRSLSDQPAVVPRRVGVVHTRRHFRKILEARTASNYLTMAETR